ncbi:PMS1 protein homolog 1 isoform X2 [Stigmatopora argus]
MKQLPRETVRLLSSAQVITSVTNVVKELLENSLDAGASAIDVILENYGLDRIEVRDNGRGIAAADTPVMAMPNFTSKIQSHEDLEGLQTYGFRGVALGSICAVAEVMITTKTEDDDISTQYTLNNQGSVVSQKPTHFGQGTTVSALELFKNVPVRRQYFSSTKKCKEEVKKVQDLLLSYAIVIPDLRLTLNHNKVLIWQKIKAANHRDALLAMLGSHTVANLLPCHHHQEEAEIFLEGFFPKPGADVSSTSTLVPKKTFIYINNRPVHHKEITKLLRQHYAAQYHDKSAQNRYPIVMLKIAVSPASVDVNLTPDKTQVLLHNKEALFTALEALLVSLYGYRPSGDAPTEQLCPETSSKTGAVEAEALRHVTNPNLEEPQSRRTPNGDSSPSAADDRTVKRMAGGDETLRSPTELPEETEKNADSSRWRISSEEWSKGTALTDPVSGEPLRPVTVHQISAPIGAVDDGMEAGKKTGNVITEKRVALSAFDLIGNRALRAPQSALALFEKEARLEVLRENPAAGLQEISMAVNDRWTNLMEEERKIYEEKAQKQVELHHRTCAAKLAHSGRAKERRSVSAPGSKRKAPFSNQQLLDELFSSQTHKKPRSSPPPPPKPSRPLACCLSSIRSRLRRLASYRSEETLLLQRLLQNHVLPAVTLQNPIHVTESCLGGSDYTEALCNMEKQSPDVNGRMFISDPRLVANGFKVTLTPGHASAGRHLEVTALADCVPFLGLEDLGEIVTAVFRRKAKTVQECRPLKVSNYLQSEAVRLARKMPAHLSREDAEVILRRMEQQLGENMRTCFHGRDLVHTLCDVPQNDEQARALFQPLAL